MKINQTDKMGDNESSTNEGEFTYRPLDEEDSLDDPLPPTDTTMRVAISHAFIQSPAPRTLKTEVLKNIYENLYDNVDLSNLTEEEKRDEILQGLKNVEMNCLSKDSSFVCTMKLTGLADETDEQRIEGEADALYGLGYFPPDNRIDYKSIHFAPNEKVTLEVQILTKKENQEFDLVQAKIREVVPISLDGEPDNNSEGGAISIKKWIKKWQKSSLEVARASVTVEVYPLEPSRPNKVCNPYKESATSWIKLNLFLFRKEPESRKKDDDDSKNFCCCLPCPCCCTTYDVKFNEFPHVPFEEQDDCCSCEHRKSCLDFSNPLKRKKIKTILIRNVRIIKIMLENYDSPSLKKEIIKFALNQCHPDLFEQVFAICLYYSPDPISTALLGTVTCIEREKKSGAGGAHWNEKSIVCTKVANQLGNFVANYCNEPQDTHYSIMAAQFMLDQNLVYAIEHEIIEVCGAPVFAERTSQRWSETRSLVLVPKLSPVSPNFSFYFQAIFFVIFFLLLLYISSTYYKNYNIIWVNKYDELLFSKNFTDITTDEEFYNWLKYTLVPNIFKPTNDSHYGNYLYTPYVIMRQIRVLPVPCFRNLSTDCYGDITPQTGLTYEQHGGSHSGAKWEPFLEGSELLGLNGDIRYHTGGYALFLSGTNSEVLQTISQLETSNYLDKGTKAVIIEFAISNVNNNNISMIIEILVEWISKEITNCEKHLVVVQPTASLNGSDYYIYIILFVLIFGYTIQESAEFIVLLKSRYETVKIRKLKEREEQSAYTVPLFSDRLRNISILKYAITHHYKDLWNILDTLINLCTGAFLVISYITNYVDQFKNPSTGTLQRAWQQYHIIEAGNMCGSLAVILCAIRVLYFTLRYPTIGPLVLGMLRMNMDILWFITLLAVFIIGFSSALSGLYSGAFAEYNRWTVTVFSIIQISLGEFEYPVTEEFGLLPISGFGQFLISLFYLISAILLINFLIAIMNGTWENLRNILVLKWHHLNGQLLLHYERFVFLPPPFNIPHFGVHLLAYLIPSLKKKWITDGRWRLVGKWLHDENWKVQKKLELFNERMTWPYGGINMYSTNAWKEYVTQEISKLVEEQIREAHEDVVRRIKRMWQKQIKKKMFYENKKNGRQKHLLGDILHTVWMNKALPNLKKIIKHRITRIEKFFLELRNEKLKKSRRPKRGGLLTNHRNPLSPSKPGQTSGPDYPKRLINYKNLQQNFKLNSKKDNNMSSSTSASWDTTFSSESITEIFLDEDDFTYNRDDEVPHRDYSRKNGKDRFKIEKKYSPFSTQVLDSDHEKPVEYSGNDEEKVQIESSGEEEDAKQVEYSGEEDENTIQLQSMGQNKYSGDPESSST